MEINNESYKKYNIEEIQFEDDNFTFNKERAKEIFRQLKQRNIDSLRNMQTFLYERQIKLSSHLEKMLKNVSI